MGPYSRAIIDIDGLRKRGVDVDKLGREIVTRMEP